jgi:hypothetical protein
MRLFNKENGTTDGERLEAVGCGGNSKAKDQKGKSRTALNGPGKIPLSQAEGLAHWLLFYHFREEVFLLVGKICVPSNSSERYESGELHERDRGLSRRRQQYE